jgi:malonyl-CoA/methylmalonyl-CoA synthetase
VAQIELIRRAGDFGDRPAILSEGQAYSYRDLLAASARVAGTLLAGSEVLEEARVAFLIPGSFEYAAVQWGVWRAGGIAVPLSISATEAELEHVLADSEAGIVLAQRRLVDRIEPLCRRLGVRLLAAEDAVQGRLEDEPGAFPDVLPEHRGMILYTSGTTSKPKGVVSTHANIEAQIRSLVEAWGWRPDDRIPLFLPLHHVHGIVNVLNSALWSGAFVEAFPTFDLEAILQRVRQKAYTLFMAVPTIYVKLIHALEEAAPAKREAWARGFRDMRLMISGSAALPASIHERWTELTGQKLLERYGMTEIGMGLSNPLSGERRPGAVGQPLPGVQIRLVGESGGLIEGDREPGEIQVRGPNVFEEYWKKPEVTEESFVDGWFRTGDMAVLDDGYYRIMGRLSVDIIKSGGEKISALEIEDVLRQHPAVRECAVVGVADEVWGEAVAVAAVVTEGESLSLDQIKAWAGERLSSYKLPKKLKVVADFPRNAMGKVMKPAVKELFSRD